MPPAKKSLAKEIAVSLMVPIFLVRLSNNQYSRYTPLPSTAVSPHRRNGRLCSCVADLCNTMDRDKTRELRFEVLANQA